MNKRQHLISHFVHSIQSSSQIIPLFMSHNYFTTKHCLIRIKNYAQIRNLSSILIRKFTPSTWNWNWSNFNHLLLKTIIFNTVRTNHKWILLLWMFCWVYSERSKSHNVSSFSVNNLVMCKSLSPFECFACKPWQLFNYLYLCSWLPNPAHLYVYTYWLKKP